MDPRDLVFLGIAVAVAVAMIAGVVSAIRALKKKGRRSRKPETNLTERNKHGKDA